MSKIKSSLKNLEELLLVHLVDLQPDLRGYYIYLLLFTSKKEKLADNDSVLARMLNIHTNAWKKAKACLIKLGYLKVVDGYLCLKFGFSEFSEFDLALNTPLDTPRVTPLDTPGVFQNKPLINNNIEKSSKKADENFLLKNHQESLSADNTLINNNIGFTEEQVDYTEDCEKNAANPLMLSPPLISPPSPSHLLQLLPYNSLGLKICSGSQKKSKPKKNYDLDFGKFWTVFSELGGRDWNDRKADAEKRFINLIKKGVKPDEIIRRAEQYAERCRKNNTNKDYITKPVNWLKHCYKDDYSPSAASNGGSEDFVAQAIEFERLAKFKKQGDDVNLSGMQSVN